MRKLLLILAVTCGFGPLLAQTDSVRFSYNVEAPSRNIIVSNNSVYADALPRVVHWEFGDGVTAHRAPNQMLHHYNAVGTYTVCLKIYKMISPTDSVVTGTLCQPVSIPEICQAFFTSADTLEGGVAVTRFFGSAHSNAERAATQVCWIFGDGSDTCFTIGPNMPLAAALQVRHHYTQPGTYTACLKINFAGGCQSQDCHPINVQSPPPPPADSCRAQFGIEPVTATPLARRFNAQPWHSTNKRVLKVCWTFGDGRDTCLQYGPGFTGPYTATHNYAAFGTYTTCVTIFYDGGCQSSECHPVPVLNPAPNDSTCVVRIYESGASGTTAPERHFFVTPGTDRVATRLCWTFGDGRDTCYDLPNPATLTSLGVNHRYAAPGTYTVCAKLYYLGGCVAVSCRTVIVRASNGACGAYLTDSLTAERTIFFRGAGIQPPNDHVINYRWTFGDGTQGNGENVTHTYAVRGTYNVCLTTNTSLGCESKVCKPVTTLGSLQTQLTVTPNPVLTVIHAAFISTRTETVQILIFNGNGITVRTYTRPAAMGLNTWDFDVTTLPAGIYSMSVQSPGQMASALFFKQ
jgi:PKD repeat protein